MEDPIIIIGAARSGTNMLRDIITRLPGFGTWPCDEINYIWRHGNITCHTDEFTEDMATNKITKYIKKEFDKIANRYNFAHLVEKTCANSLRVNFILKIFPNAKFVFIYRDGRDVVVSATKRWKAELDWLYLLKKARYVPVSDIPFYGVKFLYNRIYRFFAKEKRLAFWGPCIQNMHSILLRYSIEEVCALQWQRSVEKAKESFDNLDSTRVLTVRYEDFVKNPVSNLNKLENYLDSKFTEASLENIINNISDKSVGLWKKELSSSKSILIEKLIFNTLRKFDYA